MDQKHRLGGFSKEVISKPLHKEWNRALMNAIFKSLHAESADIELAFAVDDLLCKHLPDGRRVFESMARTRRRNHYAVVIGVNVDDEIGIVVVYRQLAALLHRSESPGKRPWTYSLYMDCSSSTVTARCT
jgi:hypothetical protein